MSRDVASEMTINQQRVAAEAKARKDTTLAKIADKIASHVLKKDPKEGRAAGRKAEERGKPIKVYALPRTPETHSPVSRQTRPRGGGPSDRGPLPLIQYSSRWEHPPKKDEFYLVTRGPGRAMTVGRNRQIQKRRLSYRSLIGGPAHTIGKFLQMRSSIRGGRT